MRYANGRTARTRKPDPAEIPVIAVRCCDWPGCSADGGFRAPRGRDKLTEYFWFCLAHVRDYNASWNYYKGMTEDEIEADVRADTVWQRPSWPFIKAMHAASFRASPLFEDIDGSTAGGREQPRSPGQRSAAAAESRALAMLDLTPPLTLAIVKARYKTLVKLYHPDANDGDKAAEEKFKDISEAYRIVIGMLGP